MILGNLKRNFCFFAFNTEIEPTGWYKAIAKSNPEKEFNVIGGIMLDDVKFIKDGKIVNHYAKGVEINFFPSDISLVDLRTKKFYYFLNLDPNDPIVEEINSEIKELKQIQKNRC